MGNALPVTRNENFAEWYQAVIRAEEFEKKVKELSESFASLESKNKKLLQNYIQNNNLSKNIKVAGYKKNPYPYIKKADAFILSSKL